MVLDGGSHRLQMKPRSVRIGADQVAVDGEGWRRDEDLERISDQRQSFALQRRVVEVEFHTPGQCLEETTVHLEQQRPQEGVHGVNHVGMPSERYEVARVAVGRMEGAGPGLEPLACVERDRLIREIGHHRHGDVATYMIRASCSETVAHRDLLDAVVHRDHFQRRWRRAGERELAKPVLVRGVAHEREAEVRLALWQSRLAAVSVIHPQL